MPAPACDAKDNYLLNDPCVSALGAFAAHIAARLGDFLSRDIEKLGQVGPIGATERSVGVARAAVFTDAVEYWC